MEQIPFFPKGCIPINNKKKNKKMISKFLIVFVCIKYGIETQYFTVRTITYTSQKDLEEQINVIMKCFCKCEYRLINLKKLEDY